MRRWVAAVVRRQAIEAALRAEVRVRGSMARAPAYGASKVGMNGLSVHMQVEENDRAEETRINTFVVAPGLLSTSFTGFSKEGKDPEEGAEAVVRLALEETDFEGGSFLEWDGGELKRVPW